MISERNNNFNFIYRLTEKYIILFNLINFRTIYFLVENKFRLIYKVDKPVIRRFCWQQIEKIVATNLNQLIGIFLSFASFLG